MDDISRFIKGFHISDNNIDTVFTSFGACYWFAYIIYRRFIRDGAVMMYAHADKHFGTKVVGKVYDITGDVTDKYEWEPWLGFGNEAVREKIIHDYIMF